MSSTENLKKYIFECCSFLDIKVEDLGSGIFRLFIPDSLSSEFIEENIDIVFYETEKLHLTYVTLESHLLQKLSKLILKLNNGVASVVRVFKIDKIRNEFEKTLKENQQIQYEESYYIEEDFLFLWLKLSIRAHHLEEYIITYKYNFKTEELQLLKNFSIDNISNLQDVINNTYTNEDIKEVVSSVMYEAQPIIIEFVSKKQEEYNLLMNKEIERINNYYRILEQEKISKISEDDDEIDNIINEKENLIEQQYTKYNINYNQVSLEVISLLLVKQQIEEQKVTIIDNTKETVITLNAIKKDYN